VPAATSTLARYSRRNLVRLSRQGGLETRPHMILNPSRDVRYWPDAYLGVTTQWPSWDSISYVL